VAVMKRVKPRYPCVNCKQELTMPRLRQVNGTLYCNTCYRVPENVLKEFWQKYEEERKAYADYRGHNL
jgi:late competence protein required for DNA uptake (superfamily II DNA/RNA helicase)